MTSPPESLLGRDAEAGPARRPRWGDVAEAARQLSPAEWRTLLLLARLPLLWTGAVATLCGLRSASRVHAHVARLRAAGLVDSCRPSHWPLPWPGRGHPPRLLYLTDAGAAAVALAAPSGAATDDGASAPATISGDAFPCGAVRPDPMAPLRAMIPGVAHRAAAYALLAWLSGEQPGTPWLLAWEAPWRGRHTPGAPGDAEGLWRAGGVRTVTLPAGAVLGWHGSTDRGATTAAYVLLPDLGTAPVTAFRQALAGLTVLARRWHDGAATAPGNGGSVVAHPQVDQRRGEWRGVRELVIATPERRRGEAWRRLLDEVADARGLVPPPARITTWQPVLGARPGPQPGAGGSTGRLHRVRVIEPSPSRIGRPIPATDAFGFARADAGARLSTADRMLLDVVGRHPFLGVDDLATVLAWPAAETRRRRDTLRDGGLLRLVDPAEVDERSRHEVEAGLTELTSSGVALVAAQQGLTVGAAVRHNGLVGGGPEQPRGTRLSRGRYGLLRHLAHTRGADRFFVALASGDRGTGAPPNQAALLVWRNAVACARGRLRPDGYGVLRAGGRRHGFFLEYDRGTQDAAAYCRKLAAYYAYRDSGCYRRDYDGFPTILIVTTATETENRIARYACAAAAGRGQPLPLLITCEWRYEWRALRRTGPAAPLGPVWRTPPDAARRPWPP